MISKKIVEHWDVSGAPDGDELTTVGGEYLTPEMQYLAPEDYELPDPDPALLASANRMLSERLAGVAHVLRGSGLPGLAEIDDGEDLQPHVAALAGAYQMAVSRCDALNHRLQAADAELVEASEALIRIIGDDTSVDTSDLSLAELVGEVEQQISHLRACLENRVPAYDANQMTLEDELKSLRKRLISADDEICKAGEALLRIVRPGCDIDPGDMGLSELVAEAGKQMNRLRLEIETLKNNYSVQVQEGEDLRQKLEALQRTVPTDPAYPALPTYHAGKHQTRVGSLFVMQPDDTIFSELTTTVRIADEAAGEFVEVEQSGRNDLGKIAICRDEWPALATAINLMIAQCRGAE